MNNFKALLEKQIKKASTTAAAAPAPKANAPPAMPAKAAAVQEGEGTESEPLQKAIPKRPSSLNTNRVTINLFESDRRALAVIKEGLSTAGHDFTTRSDSIKIALRLATRAKPDELARLYEQIKAEDHRFKAGD